MAMPNTDVDPPESDLSMTLDPSAPSHYVCIGASAGGLSPIEDFFSVMPPDTGMAFIVIQHLSPDHKSLMAELISKRTRMPVHRVTEGIRAEADTINVIPPKKNLKIFHGKLLLDDQDPDRGINLPIDIFLKSLAEDQGEKAVAVILSGTGSDGTRGIRTIKEWGGMVMVQEPESAKFDGMPVNAIATGLADFILRPEEMPRQLVGFAKHLYAAKNDTPEILLTEEDRLNRIFSLLREKTGVDFTHYKPSTVARRIERRMSVNQIRELAEYVKYLERYPEERQILYREMLIGVTSFFRDPNAFELLGENYLPAMLREKDGGEARFWVTGCSSGEEPYSLAILTRKCLERENLDVNIKIFSTDVDRDAINNAGQGIYPESIAADVSGEDLSRYFVRKGDRFQISREIREMVVFAQHNLIKDPPFTNIELVSCRNLLIYLQPVLQNKVLSLFNFSLNPKGILFLGTSESTGEMSDYFEPLHHKWKLYRSLGKRRHPSEAGLDVLVGAETARQPAIGRRDRYHPMFRAQREEQVLSRLMDGVVSNYMPLTVVVNERMELSYILGETEGLFKLPTGRMHNDITKMAVSDLSVPLATGLRKTFKTVEAQHYTNVRVGGAGEDRLFDLWFRPLPRRRDQDALVAVVIEPTEPRAPSAEVAEGISFDMGREAQERIQDLESELQYTRENLQATIEELETSNEELQATNEELMASNEELQSTNEELQSVNEELYTVNSEYQSKIMELTELNNDMNNLLASTRIATLFLDENLEIRKFTPEADHIYQILNSDVGRPISHLSHRLENVDPLKAVDSVQRTGEQVEWEVQNADGRWFLMRVLPYQVGPRDVSGVVLTFIDIDPLKRTRYALEKSRRQLKETARLANVGSWEYRPESERLVWSGEIYGMLGLNSKTGVDLSDWTARFVPEFRKSFSDAIRQASDPDVGKGFDRVLQIETNDGRRRWVRVIGRPRTGRDGTIRITGAFQDVTQIREAEAARAESEERYRLLFERMLNGFALHEIETDDAGRPVDYVFLEVNAAFEALTGLKRDDIIGHRVSDVIPGIREGDTDWIDLYGRVALTGEPARFEQYSESFDKWFSVSAYCPSKGRFVTVFEDITGRVRAEEKRRETQEMLEGVLETSPLSIMVFSAVRDRSGEIVDFEWVMANPSAARTVGRTPEDLVGRRLLDVTPGNRDTGLFDAYVNVVESASPWRTEQYYEQDGIVAWFDIAAVKLGDGFVVTYDDVTDRKESERRLKRANRLFRTLGRWNQSLVRSRDPIRLVTEQCRSVVEVGGYGMCWIGMAETDGEDRPIRPLAWWGVDDDYLAGVRITWDDTETGRGPAGMAVRTAEPAVIRHLDRKTAFAPWRERATAHGFAAAIGLPLRSGDGAFGVMGIYSADGNAFDEAEVEMLQNLADSLAFGLACLSHHHGVDEAVGPDSVCQALGQAIAERKP